MGLFDRFHRLSVKSWRERRLVAEIAPLLPDRAHVLDVGCGDGRLASGLKRLRPDIEIRGIDVKVSSDGYVPVEAFDGTSIPFPPDRFDVVTFVDVLHHASAPVCLLREASRVTKEAILVKDHLLEGALAGPTLRFMDRVGNAGRGIAMPHDYWPEAKWRATLAELGLGIRVWKHPLRLYPVPATWLFDRRLHFLAVLDRADAP